MLQRAPLRGSGRGDAARCRADHAALLRQHRARLRVATAMTSPPPPALDGFSADWLTLREPFDTAARDRAADALGLAQLPAWAAARCVGGRALEVLDLGCGTGANLRHLAPRLGGVQRWWLVDHDPALLAAQPARLQAWADARGDTWRPAVGGAGSVIGASRQEVGGGLQRSPVEAVLGLLSGPGYSAEIRHLALDLSRDAAALPWTCADLVTASALLDLLSEPGLAALLQPACAAGAAMLWSLNVDARRLWTPPHADAAEVAALFGRHQQRDKGYGPALGPEAGATAAALLRAAGWRVSQAPSDWWVDAAAGPIDRALLAALVSGAAEAAEAQWRDEARTPLAAGTADAAWIAGWAQRRLAAMGAAQPRVAARIGHLEVLALPPDRARRAG